MMDLFSLKCKVLCIFVAVVSKETLATIQYYMRNM